MSINYCGRTKEYIGKGAATYIWSDQICLAKNTIEKYVISNDMFTSKEGGLTKDDCKIEPELTPVVYHFNVTGYRTREGPGSYEITRKGYKGTNLEGKVTGSGGVQRWTVPASGNYKITAVGGGVNLRNTLKLKNNRFAAQKRTVISSTLDQKGETLIAGVENHQWSVFRMVRPKVFTRWCRWHFCLETNGCE